MSTLSDHVIDARAQSHDGGPRAELRSFLQACRGRISPEQAGLPSLDADRRRRPGLRREETALLAGVSPSYYIRLERGHAHGVSPAVVDGIARALRLDAEDRARLLDLLHALSDPARIAPLPSRSRPRVRPTIQQLLDAMPTVPALVVDGRLDVLAHNGAARFLFFPWLETGRAVNVARLVFLDASATSLFPDWDVVADNTVARLRSESGRRPLDRRLSGLVGELSTRSQEFRVRWAARAVRTRRADVVRIRHPQLGDLRLDVETLAVADGAVVVACVPPSGSPSHDALASLAAQPGAHETPPPG